MKFRADISTIENDGREQVLSVCQCGPVGTIEHEIIIQRHAREYDIVEESPGPKISCDELGLDIAPGPERITFAGNIMTIVLLGSEDIEVDIFHLPGDEQKELKEVAKAVFE